MYSCLKNSMQRGAWKVQSMGLHRLRPLLGLPRRVSGGDFSAKTWVMGAVCHMKSWRKRVLVEQRASTNIFRWKALGIAEDQKVGEGGPGMEGSWQGSEAQRPSVQGSKAWGQVRTGILAQWGGCYRSLAVSRSFEEKGMINRIIYGESQAKEQPGTVHRIWQRAGELWNIPGRDFRPWMISCLLFCSEMRSSDIIRPNITKEMNWLV